MNEVSNWQDVDGGERSALTALCVEYAWRVDNYRTETVAELFADDGVWQAFGQTVAGRVALTEFWKGRAQAGNKLVRRHLLSNFRFVKENETTIRGWHALTYFEVPIGQEGTATPVMVGEYDDLFRRGGNGSWLIGTRKMSPIFPRNWPSRPPQK